MSQFVADEKEGGPQILECHSPILNLLDQYPIIGRLEQDMFEGVARHGSPPGRDPHLGPLRVRFLFRSLILLEPAPCRRTRASLPTA